MYLIDLCAWTISEMTKNMPIQSVHVEPVVEKDAVEQVCVSL